MSLSRPAFIRLWLLAAIVVAATRCLFATRLGYDLSIQVQAAQNLVAGHGLSIYALNGGDDLAAPNQLRTLTYFPAGHSLLTALFLAIGISPAISTKLLAAAATVLGWWGWGRLAHFFIMRRSGQSRVTTAIASVVAFTTPIFFTPQWSGSDIFLWAAVPWLVDCLLSLDRKHTGWNDFAAGAIAGVATLMRYQGLVLAAYGALWLILKPVSEWKISVGRLTRFAAGFVPLIAVQLYVNSSSKSAILPGGLGFNAHMTSRAHSIWTNLGHGFFDLTAINFPILWWLPHRALLFVTRSGIDAPWLLAVTLAVFAALILIWFMQRRTNKIDRLSSDPAVTAAGLFVAFPIFLWGCALGGVLYVAVLRYYTPLIPLALISATALALTERNRPQSACSRVLQTGGAIYLALYLVIVLVGLLLLAIPAPTGTGRRDLLLGQQGKHRLGAGFDYESSPARQYVIRLLKEQPQTILVTHRPQCFYAEPTIDRSRLHRLERLRADHITGPVHIVISSDDPFPERENAVFWVNPLGRLVQAHQFDSVPNLHLLRRFPEENFKVFELDVAAGRQIQLNTNGRY